MQPDIVAPKEQALIVAQITVIKDQLKDAKDDGRREYLNDVLGKREKEREMLKTQGN